MLPKCSKITRRPPRAASANKTETDALRHPNSTTLTREQIIREKAFRLGIRTGCTPDFNLIWESQRFNGFDCCFGSHSQHCTGLCRWHDKCCLVTQEPIDTPLPAPLFSFRP